MIIKAGTYRLNDEINTPSKDLAHIPFTYSVGKITMEGYDTNLIPNIFTSISVSQLVHNEWVAFENLTSPNTLSLQEEEIPISWFTLYFNQSYPLRIVTPEYQTLDIQNFTFDRLINVNYDFTPSNEDETLFSIWFTENTEPVGNTPAVEITYKDKVITLKAGQTARLHNSDGSPFGFEEDLVIKANEVETVAEWDGSFSKSKLIRIFVTGLADEVPHEEFVLSGTWRSFLEYCASVNWTTFTSEDYDGTTCVKYNGYFLNKSVGGVPALVPISDSIVEDYEYTYNNM